MCALLFPIVVFYGENQLRILNKLSPAKNKDVTETLFGAFWRYSSIYWGLAEA